MIADSAPFRAVKKEKTQKQCRIGGECSRLKKHTPSFFRRGKERPIFFSFYHARATRAYPVFFFFPLSKLFSIFFFTSLEDDVVRWPRAVFFG